MPDHFRYTSYAAARLHMECTALDPGGYLYQVSSGDRSILLGAGRLCPYPLNSAAAFCIAQDKAFTNRILDQHGIPNLGGRCFFLSDHHRKLRGKGYEIGDARAYLGEIGFPCFCKPLTGSRGDLAETIRSTEQFDRYVERAKRKYDSIIVQRLFRGQEYRVFVLDAAIKFCLQKADPLLTGDGTSTVGELVERLNAELHGTGVSCVSDDEVVFAANGERISRNEVPGAGERCRIDGRKNLSARASPGMLIDPCPDQLARVAAEAAAAIGLRVAGVDLLIDADSGAPRVIEVNGMPGIHALELLNRWDLIAGIWEEVLQKAFATP